MKSLYNVSWEPSPHPRENLFWSWCIFFLIKYFTLGMQVCLNKNLWLLEFFKLLEWYPFFIYFPCNIIYSIYIHIYSTALVHLFQHFHSVSMNEYNTIPSFIHYIWIFRGLQYFAIPKKYCSEHSFICSLWTCDRFPRIYYQKWNLSVTG